MAKRKFKSQTCPNCGYRFGNASERTNYCPECGQENYDLNAPFRHLVKEAAETIFHFDTRSVKTLKALLFRPGFLTAEFVRGKRASYVKPMRFYIFFSFLFFLFSDLPFRQIFDDDDDRNKDQRDGTWTGKIRWFLYHLLWT